MIDSMTVCPTSKSPPYDASHDDAQQPRLSGRVQRVVQLTANERDQMFALMQRYFEGVSRAQFERDLDEKEWIILLQTSGRVCGFSTLMRMETTVDNQPIVAFFSGDTIIERAHWGQSTLMQLWARHAFDLAAEVQRLNADARVFWFLITSGYKTYRFLPVFFREFYPHCEHPTPPEIQGILKSLGEQKFADHFDGARGVVPLSSPLRQGIAELTRARLNDPHVAFFARANPHHADGDELACLCELSPANLTAAGRRMLKPQTDTDNSG